MKFEDAYFSREDRYSLGVESTSGRNYVSIPVSNGVVDYEEYYELTPGQFEEFLLTAMPQFSLSSRVVAMSRTSC